MGAGLDFALDVGAHVLQQFFDVAFGLAQRLGELGIDLRQHGLGHLLDGDLELGRFAGDFLAAVVGRELEREGGGVARLQAAHGGFELRQHAALAQHEGEVLGRAAVEGDAVDGAGEVERDAVVVLGGAIVAGLVDGPLLAQDVDGALYFGVADLHRAARDLQCGEIGRGDFGIYLEGGREAHVAFFDAFGLGLEIGGAGNAQAGVANGLVERPADLGVDDVVADAGAVAALDHGQRRLARTKALNLGGARNTLELRLDFFFDIGNRNDDIDTTLQARQSFNHGLLHWEPI